MALEKTRLLTLFEIKKIEFEDSKEKGLMITKFKYSFFDELDNLVTGYLDEEYWLDDIISTGSFDKDGAIETVWTGREFNEELKWRLSAPS